MNQLVFIDKDWKENNAHVASETEYYNYKNILEYNRVLIDGPAGTAKSHNIKQLKQELVIDFAYLAFTHTAANNIDGQTAHSFYGMSIDGKIDENKMREILNNKKGVIIDKSIANMYLRNHG